MNDDATSSAAAEVGGNDEPQPQNIDVVFQKEQSPGSPILLYAASGANDRLPPNVTTTFTLPRNSIHQGQAATLMFSCEGQSPITINGRTQPNGAHFLFDGAVPAPVEVIPAEGSNCGWFIGIFNVVTDMRTPGACRVGRPCTSKQGTLGTCRPIDKAYREDDGTAWGAVCDPLQKLKTELLDLVNSVPSDDACMTESLTVRLAGMPNQPIGWKCQ